MCYHLKLSKQSLPRRNPINITYFPFDSVYICNKKDFNRIVKAFPYAFTFVLTPPVRTIFKMLDIQKQQTLSLRRDDVLSKKRNLTTAEKKACWDFLDQGEWMCIAPTVIMYLPQRSSYPVHTWIPRTKRNAPSFKKQKGTQPKKIQPEIAYTGSRNIVSSWLNMTASITAFPPLHLHTPHGVIRSVCALCAHVMEHHQNKCSIGSTECIRNMNIGNLEPHFDDPATAIAAHLNNVEEEKQ